MTGDKRQTLTATLSVSRQTAIKVEATNYRRPRKMAGPPDAAGLAANDNEIGPAGERFDVCYDLRKRRRLTATQEYNDSLALWLWETIQWFARLHEQAEHAPLAKPKMQDRIDIDFRDLDTARDNAGDRRKAARKKLDAIRKDIGDFGFEFLKRVIVHNMKPAAALRDDLPRLSSGKIPDYVNERALETFRILLNRLARKR